jgi:uncharacterized protein with HEPN domain
MRDERDDIAWLWDMLQACRHVETFVSGKTFADFEDSLLLRSAVERQIEIVGEAARHVSPEFQADHPEIAWRPIKAQRHVLAHDYGEIRYDLIWRVATRHVPELIALLNPLVPLPPPDEEGDSNAARQC